MSPNPIVNMLQPASNPLAGVFNTLKAAFIYKTIRIWNFCNSIIKYNSNTTQRR